MKRFFAATLVILLYFLYTLLLLSSVDRIRCIREYRNFLDNPIYPVVRVCTEWRGLITEWRERFESLRW